MKAILIVIILLIPQVSFGQNRVDVQGQTIIRLIVVKDKEKILMRNTENGWMTPALYFTSRQNIHQVLDSIATSYGIKISQVKLGGLFTYKYMFKPTVDMRQHYIAYYESGELKAANAKETVEWMSKENAIDKLSNTVPSLGEQTKQILAHPETVWGGSFILDRIDGKLTSKIEEAFYPLN